MSKKMAPFLGIMVAASSREEAERLYAETALGQKAMAYADRAKTLQFVTHAECSDLLNPQTGKTDLEEEKELVTKLEFLSSGTDTKVHYTVCKDGCGSHLISESSDAMKHCISCGSETKDLSAEDIAKAETLDIDASGVVAVASTMQGAVKRYIGLASGKLNGKFLQDQEGNVFLTNAKTEHKFNVFTGNQDLSVSENHELQALASAGSDLKAFYYVCANTEECGLHVVSTSQDAVICPSCSSGLVEPEDEEDEELDIDAELDDMDLEDEEDIDEEEMEEDEESDSSTPKVARIKIKSESSDDEDSDDEDDDSEDDSDEEEEYSDLEDSDSDDVDEDAEMEEDEESESSSEPITETVVQTQEQSNDEPVVDPTPVTTEQVPVETQEPVETVQVKVDAVALSGAKPQDLSVVFTTINHVPTWLAIANNLLIAKANPVSSARHSDIFTNKVFGEALLASAKENGVDVALTDLGFEKVVVDLPVPKFVQEQVEQQVSEQVASVSSDAQAKLDQVEERYQAALATAFAGVNKGLFKGIKNPIQTSLIAALSSAGIKNSDLLVNQVFESSSTDYISKVMAKAGEIMQYTAQAQNEIAKMVSESNFQPLSDSRSLGDRLGSIATAAEPTQDQPNVSLSTSQQPKPAKVEDFARKADRVLNFSKR
jgi:hypothetical protein